MRKKYKRKTFEIVFYEKILEYMPDFVQALSCLGDAYTRKGFYEEGLSVDRRLAELRPDDPMVRYNLACSFSLLNNVKESLSELKKAVLYGYEDISYLMADPDLENIRKDPHFQEFVEKVNNLDGVHPNPAEYQGI